MNSLYEAALKLKEQGDFSAARTLFESLLNSTDNSEDRAYLLLHLATCLHRLRLQELAQAALKEGSDLAPEGSRFPLDAGIEEAVWKTEAGDYHGALTNYAVLIERFSTLLEEPEEEVRSEFIRCQMAELTGKISTID